MRPITGGNVPPDRVVWRDAFIRKMWKTLQDQSVVLVSERRIGKTSVIRKMEKECQEGWHAIYLVIEGVRSPTEFVSRIFDAASPILSRKGRIFSRVRDVYSEVAGQAIGNWALPELKNNWKRLLKAVLTDIRDNFDERVVFLWDELPLMISNIKDDLGVKTAMELLDELRDYRQSDDSGTLRMVYTGSIGLHLVVSELLREGYRNDPTNDMVTYSLDALEPDYARELASRDLQALVDEGEMQLGDPLEDIAQAVAEATEGLPYHISCSVVHLSEIAQLVSVADVKRAVDSLVLHPEDPACFRHYSERIESYYRFQEQARPLAFAILKALCATDRPMSEDAVWDGAVTQMELTDRDLFHTVLQMLMKDHYLNRALQGTERTYQFKYDIIRRWWLMNRG